MTATWIAFILYAAAAIALGWSAYRRGGAPADFWTAKRRLDGFSVGLSLSAGFMSVSWSCVYAVQLFYWFGLGGIILAYYLEVHGPLAAWEPAWLADTGLGFIIWGILAAGAGYAAGALTTLRTITTFK